MRHCFYVKPKQRNGCTPGTTNINTFFSSVKDITHLKLTTCEKYVCVGFLSRICLNDNICKCNRFNLQPKKVEFCR